MTSHQFDKEVNIKTHLEISTVQIEVITVKQQTFVAGNFHG